MGGWVGTSGNRIAIQHSDFPRGFQSAWRLILVAFKGLLKKPTTKYEKILIRFSVPRMWVDNSHSDHFITFL